MNPQEPPATQPNPAPMPAPTTPDVPAPPQPTPAVSQPPAPTPLAPASPTPPPTGRKNKLWLILGIVAVVIIVLLVTLFLFLVPNLQANKTSNNFMHDITTGNVSAAAVLTDGGSSNNAFLQQAAKSVSGSYSLKSTSMQNGQGYYLYNLTNSTNKYARTIIKKESGGWKITSFVFSSTPLALVPSKTASIGTSTGTSSQSASTSTSTNGCLTANDFSFFSNVDSSSPTPTPNGLYEDFYQLQFNPNDATYASGDVPDPTTVFNDFKNFYTKDANKKYNIELESSVNSSSPDDQLARCAQQ